MIGQESTMKAESFPDAVIYWWRLFVSFAVQEIRYAVTNKNDQVRTLAALCAF